MQKGQEQFFDFILECVLEGKEEQARTMLTESFQQQAKGAFSQEKLDAFHNELEKILKPERKDEVMDIINQFGGEHVSK